MAIKITQEQYQKKFGTTALQTALQPKPGIFSQAKQQMGQALQGGISQAKQGISELGSAKNLGQFGEGIGRLGSGIASGVTSPLAPVFAPIGKGINFVAENAGKNPLGGKNNTGLVDTSQFQKFATSKAGEATSRSAENVANFSNIAGTIGAFGEGAPKIEAGVKATGELAGRATGGTLNTLGRGLKTAGEKAYEITVPPTESTAHALLTYDAKQPTLIQRLKGATGEGTKPITEANTAARMGLTGTEYGLAVGAKKAATQLWDTAISPKLKAVKGAINMKSFFDQVEKQVQKTPELSRRSDVKAALQSLREDYQNVGKPIDLETLQHYKTGWAEAVPEAAYKGKPIGSALKDVKNIAAQKAREIIYKYVGDEGKQAYIDYGNLQSIIKAGEKSITGDLAKKSISRGVWQFVMDKAVTPVATTLGKVLYKTGEGLEFIGPKGAKKVGDIVGNPKIGLSFEDVSKLPNIHPEDQALMKGYIDAVRLGKSNPQLELGASRVAEHYGINPGKSSSSLANAFDDTLARLKQNYGVKKAGNIESMIENSEGWKPGMKAKFDEALINKNVETIKKLLPEVPEKYKKTFQKTIDEVLNKPSFHKTIGENELAL